jgi:long-chain acyl-CoA synthetase
MLIEPLFQHAAGPHADDVAVIDDTGRYTFKQVAAMAAGLGAFLPNVTEKDKVGLFLPSGLGFLASFYGTLIARKTVVPINFLLGELEIAHIIKDSGIDVVLTAPPLAAKLEHSGLNVLDLTQLPKPSPEQMAQYLKTPLPQTRADDLAVLMYTSGTSGMPKGVMLTYGNLHSDVRSAIQHAALDEKHKFLGILPLFHSTGMLATLLAPVELGSMIVYMGRFNPSAVIRAVKEHGLSIVTAVPSMYAALTKVKDAGPDDWKSIYASISGGEPLAAVVREGFEAKFGCKMYEGYGLTETIGPIAFNVPAARKAGSVGKIIPTAEVKMVDDDGKDLPQGQTGEILMRGPMIMKGYYQLPEVTKAALTDDGWFRSGDLGHVDEAGYLFVTGRKKELIIVAGEKAVPREIEDVLRSHPAVADAAAVGKKDPSRGEVVVAFVQLKEGQTATPEELRDHCRKQNLKQWKVPREVTIVHDLPRSPTGKVLKRVLSEQVNEKG